MIRFSRAQAVLAAISVASALTACAAVPAMHAVSASSGSPSCRGAGHRHCPGPTPTSPIPGSVSSSSAPGPSTTPPSTPPPSTTPPSTTPPTSTSPGTPPPASPTLSSWAWCSSDQNGFRQFGNLALFNGEWGSTAPQTICGNSASDWQATFSAPAGNTGILTYPDVQLNYNTSQPAISSLDPSATSSFTENMNANPGTSAEAGYDIWITGTGCNRCEVMIWTDTFNRGTVGGASSTGHHGTFCGDSSWQLYKYGSELIWYRPANQQSGSVCPAAMLQDLQAGGYLPGNAALSQFEYGWEIASTGGQSETFRMTSYSVSGLPASN